MAILDNVVEKLLTRTEFLSTEIKDWSKADGVFILDGAVGPTGTAIVNSIVLASSRVGDGVGIPEGFNEKVGVRLSVGSDLNDAWGITKDRVETQIKILKDGSKFGIVDIDEAETSIKNKDLKFLLNTFKRVSPILTSRSLFAGLKTGIGAAKMIGEVGGIVYFDQ